MPRCECCGWETVEIDEERCEKCEDAMLTAQTEDRE